MTGLIYHRARTIKRMGPNHYDNVVFQRKSANETNDFFVLVHLNCNQIHIMGKVEICMSKSRDIQHEIPVDFYDFYAISVFFHMK